ncbi:ultraviolet-B receptor UVR8 [Exaiptasia diaphana]|uniref:FYVE-type domain-containing protein n=1 Tax=Exaiptasia diaphana TaxID=2652724 RepID=A0A913YWS4_EXADI|nr:ultraviolet-B receptor UVR8 [Exaiptasia diaphana]KXJ19610.1 Ultraviolet-B receptor UVR8 [Exaiptasia diaphana]
MVQATQEEVQAVLEMTKGMTMLKAGRMGRPHFRKFKLSKDLTYLQWESPRKEKEKSVVKISQMIELVKGQKTKVFENCQIPQYECLSFSLVYRISNGSSRTLDIVCKSTQEYQIWTTGLQALLTGFSDRKTLDSMLGEAVETDQPDGENVKVEFSRLGMETIKYKEDACDVYTWGKCTKGMLGHGEDSEEMSPRVVEALLGRDIRKIACGASHMLALSRDGDVFSWGNGHGGRLGQGHLRDRFTPLRIAFLHDKDVVEVACNDLHSAVVCNNGQLLTWGKGGPWLGYDCLSKETSPRLVQGLDDIKVVQVSCGLKHTLVCSKNGKVFSFGNNDYGQLGVSDIASTAKPVCVSALSDHLIAKVACGDDHSAAVADFGALWLWGCNEYGQVGNGTFANTSKPSLFSMTDLRHEAVIDVKCGARHTVFLTKKGKTLSFGDNSEGQLGIRLDKKLEGQTQFNFAIRVHIPTDSKAMHIACGAYHTALVTDGGELFTWGRGRGGRLGHGDDRIRYLPSKVEAVEDKHVRFVSCGAEHTACTVTRAWVPDEEVKTCMACKIKFTTVRRRHHCRKCGGVFCGACTSKRIPILSLGYSNPVRVCEKCYTLISGDS